MVEEPEEIIHISVPTDERMTSVVRLATTAVASRTGLNLDQADDINTALDELFRFSVSQESKPVPSIFRIQYNIHADCLEVVTEGVGDSINDETSKVGRYCRFILEKMMDEVTQKPNPDGGLDVHIIKRISRGQ
ncbi:MAG: hypothetical protein WC828_01310 [Thermoleophilia bacterium]|jgi:anti-sigma regulatory factor (Ser/Thr protein kinase)